MVEVTYFPIPNVLLLLLFRVRAIIIMSLFQSPYYTRYLTLGP